MHLFEQTSHILKCSNFGLISALKLPAWKNMIVITLEIRGIYKVQDKLSMWYVGEYVVSSWIVLLRFSQTPITWYRSLLAILPLFWRHDIANTPTVAAKTGKVLLWRHEIHDVFLRTTKAVLGHRSQRLQWPIVIMRCPSSVVRPSVVRPSVR